MVKLRLSNINDKTIAIINKEDITLIYVNNHRLRIVVKDGVGYNCDYVEEYEE